MVILRSRLASTESAYLLGKIRRNMADDPLAGLCHRRKDCEGATCVNILLHRLTGELPLGRFRAVGSYQLDGPCFDGFRPLGFVPQNENGFAERGRLFLHAARIGHAGNDDCRIRSTKPNIPSGSISSDIRHLPSEWRSTTSATFGFGCTGQTICTSSASGQIAETASQMFDECRARSFPGGAR